MKIARSRGSLGATWRRCAGAVAALALIGVLAAPASAAPAPAPVEKPLAPALQKKLSKALDKALAETEAPGAIVGVRVGGRGWTATRGSTVRGKTTRPTLTDHTRIGSITKTFTGTVILQLVDEGKLKLSDTIDRWFPWVPNADTITVRELGDMSSGINTYTVPGPIVTRYLTTPTTIWSPGELIIGGVSQPAKFGPAQGFFYSNTNFLMLGHIAEALTGKPLAKLIGERIFKPLGMTHSSYPHNGKLPTPFWNGYTNQAVDGTPIRDATHWSPTFLSAAGQIVSTLGDMETYTQALGTGSLISKGAQRARLQPNPHSVGGGREYDFALGTDHGWLSHSGEVPGYNSEVGYLPSLKASIVVFTNTDIANKNEGAPAPTVLSALGAVLAPGNVPTP